jgi:hypothetical protein
LAAYVGEFGPADICVIGSSRAREAVLSDVAAELCRQRLGHNTSVANYACTAARATENESIVRYVLRNGRPRLILYGVSPLQLLERVEPREQIALFWSWADWWSDFHQAPDHAAGLLPVMLRAELGKCYRTLKFRDRAGVLVSDLLEGASHYGASASVSDLLAGRAFPCPFRGERSRLLFRHPNKSLVGLNISTEHVRRWIDHLMLDGRYVMDGSQPRRVEGLITACNEAGVDLVMFEIPVAEILERNYPEGVWPEFRQAMQQFARDGGVTFVTADQLGLELTDADFAEQSHVNHKGAEILTRALFEQVVIPRLEAVATAE